MELNKKQRELNKLEQLIPYSDYFEKNNPLVKRYARLFNQLRASTKHQTKIKNKITFIIGEMPF